MDTTGVDDPDTGFGGVGTLDGSYRWALPEWTALGWTLGLCAAWGGSSRVDFVGMAWSGHGVVGALRCNAGKFASL